MNRAQRRQAAKQGMPIRREPVYNMKRSDLKQMKEEATSSAIDTAMVLLLAIPIKVLHEEYGWGMKTRLPKFAEELLEEYQNFSEGEMTIEEYEQYVYDYCGLKFKLNDEEE